MILDKRKRNKIFVMIDFFKNKNNVLTKSIWILLVLLLFSNVGFSFQSLPSKDYLQSEIEVKEFDKSAWGNTISGIDYSDQTPGEKKKTKNKDTSEWETGRGYDEDESYTPPNMGEFWRGFFKFLLIALAVIVLAFIIANMVGAEGWSLAPANRKIKRKANAIPITLDNIEENIYESDLDRFIREALEKKDYPQAVRLYYLAILKELSLKKWIKWKKDKTNRDYIRELNNTNFQNGFKNVTRMFERVWYGKQELGGSDFTGSVQPEFKDLLQETQNANKKV